jgi:putative MFS transporter
MFTKGGGVLAQALSITALVPPLGVTAVIIMMPVIISLALFIRFGTETRGLDLRHLEYSRARSLPVPTATSEV